MSEYTYKNPLNEGYKKFKLTKEQHNSLFKYRQIKWFDKYEYYYNEDLINIQKFTNIFGVLLATILFPISILLEGVVNIKECWTDFKELYNQKESGSFSSDQVWKTTELYDKIMKMIK